MRKQTKLVDCGATVFVYDFQCSGSEVKELRFERDVFNGNITNMKRLLLTNFVNDILLATFCLRISLNEYEKVTDILNQFVRHLKRSSGHHDMKYLAVTKPSSDKNEDHAYILLITDIEIYELTNALDDDITEDQEEEYFEGIWGDELFIDVYSPGELIETFTSAYKKSLKINILEKFPKSFRNNLLQPSVLWNKEADTFINNHNFSKYPVHQSYEVYDNSSGFIKINEYSLYDTSSCTEEWD
ncbi:hypothetical protein IOC57_05415 [Bacillus sp. SD075]|uniref:hypothetical protein n=1 Tax=Bacillus sp. SD075 TaxID=2781732 RepID=UPI001A956C1C|nr:hypothetical protein [Bacillus sp. SD075]MBO0997203.1 hypothetical protein [Bacillus sp. SD075]